MSAAAINKSLPSADATVHCAVRHRSDTNNNNNLVQRETRQKGSDADAAANGLKVPRRIGRSCSLPPNQNKGAKTSVSPSATKMAELSRFVAKIIPRSSLPRPGPMALQRKGRSLSPRRIIIAPINHGKLFRGRCYRCTSDLHRRKNRIRHVGRDNI